MQKAITLITPGFQNLDRATTKARTAQGVVIASAGHTFSASGLAGSEGVAPFSLTRNSSTRFLRSPRSPCSHPLKSGAAAYNLPSQAICWRAEDLVLGRNCASFCWHSEFCAIAAGILG